MSPCSWGCDRCVPCSAVKGGGGGGVPIRQLVVLRGGDVMGVSLAVVRGDGSY